MEGEEQPPMKSVHFIRTAAFTAFIIPTSCQVLIAGQNGLLATQTDQRCRHRRTHRYIDCALFACAATDADHCSMIGGGS